MQFIDDAEFQIAIDLDQGARIASLKWRDMEFSVGFRATMMCNQNHALHGVDQNLLAIEILYLLGF